MQSRQQKQRVTSPSFTVPGAARGSTGTVLSGLFAAFLTVRAFSGEIPLNLPSAIKGDWTKQDSAEVVGYRTAIERISAELPATNTQTISQKLSSLSGAANSDPALRDLYYEACHYRRENRMQPYRDQMKDILFVKRGAFMTLYYGRTMTEGDGGAALCRLRMSDVYGTVDTLMSVSNKNGAIRDPSVSYDGKRILFSYKNRDDGYKDYQLFEMDLETGEYGPFMKDPITRVADYQGVYLPNGDVVFTSSRGGNIVPCDGIKASNLYICSGRGDLVRRVGFDVGDDLYPAVLNDGTICYTRRDYNDRTQIFTHALFTMNPDGTGQIGLYNTNTWWPPAIIHFLKKRFLSRTRILL